MTEMGGIEQVTTIDPSTIILGHIVGDIEIPCDFLTTWTETPHAPARWIAHRVPCPCGYKGGPRLICENCKEHLMLSDASLECVQDGCREVYSPARTIIHSIEALK